MRNRCRLSWRTAAIILCVPLIFAVLLGAAAVDEAVRWARGGEARR